MINTFGRAILLYDDKEIATSEEKTTRAIGTPDFKFLIRVNTNGSFDIQRRDGITFNLTMESTTKIFQLRARAEDMLIPPWYRLTGDILQQKYSTRSAEFAESHFRIRLAASTNVFRRVDIRFLQSSWITLLICNDQLMNACVNGPREVALLGAACDAISAAGVTRSHGLTERIRKRIDDDQTSVRSMSSVVSSQRVDSWPESIKTDTTNVPNEVSDQLDESNDLPALIPNAELIRNKYVRELEMALAAIKMPRFHGK